MGARLKTREEIDASIGVGPSTTPAPGGNTRVPSFAWEHRDKGVEFGHKLASPRTILLVRVKGLWIVFFALITVSLCAANWVPPATRYVAVAHHAWCTCADVCVYVRLPAQRREATARCRASRRRTSGSGRESYSGGESNRRAPFFKTLGIPCHQASSHSRRVCLSEKLMLARGLCSTWRKLQGAQLCCGQQAAKQGRAVRPAVEGFPTVRDADNSCSADAVVVV